MLFIRHILDHASDLSLSLSQHYKEAETVFSSLLLYIFIEKHEVRKQSIKMYASTHTHTHETRALHTVCKVIQEWSLN